MVKLTFPNFSHSLHFKISIIQSFPIQYALSPSWLKKRNIVQQIGLCVWTSSKHWKKVVFHSEFSMFGNSSLSASISPMDRGFVIAASDLWWCYWVMMRWFLWKTEGSIWSSLSFVESVAPVLFWSGRALLRMRMDTHALARNQFVKPLVRYEYFVEYCCLWKVTSTQ
jgi:hypothetical protein